MSQMSNQFDPFNPLYRNKPSTLPLKATKESKETKRQDKIKAEQQAKAIKDSTDAMEQKIDDMGNNITTNILKGMQV